eukprot:757021-Hanusia_phi.AAC.4
MVDIPSFLRLQVTTSLRDLIDNHPNKKQPLLSRFLSAQMSPSSLRTTWATVFKKESWRRCRHCSNARNHFIRHRSGTSVKSA